MVAANINHVVLVGNLATDPAIRETPTGSVCSLRVASSTRRRNGSTGKWEDKPNYFDVTVWGAQGESAARYLSKGRAVAIDGRLEWRQWETEHGETRQAVDIVASRVQFLDSPNGPSNDRDDPVASNGRSERSSGRDGIRYRGQETRTDAERSSRGGEVVRRKQQGRPQLRIVQETDEIPWDTAL